MKNQELPRLELSEFDFDFEPITRTRSNTWPLQRPEDFIEPTPTTTTSNNPQIEQSSSNDNNGFTSSSSSLSAPSSLSSHKKSSTRYAHGNTSYAEIITQAINVSKDQRLTLQEIYRWMIDNVPTIKEEDDDRGWKNSVRHNLSLQKRFVRVPNETAGKSSWWMIDPNALLEKTSRKRSASMEAGKLQGSRSRAKKNAQQMKLKQETLQLPQVVVTYADINQLVQQIPNTCRVNYTYYPILSTIAQVPDEVEYALQYNQSHETVDNNNAPMVQTSIQTIPAMVSEVSDAPSNEPVLMRFNSLLDDVTEIISKE